LFNGLAIWIEPGSFSFGLGAGGGSRPRGAIRQISCFRRIRS